MTLEGDRQISLLKLFHQRVERYQLGEEIAVDILFFLFVLNHIKVEFFYFEEVLASLINQLLELGVS